MRHYTLQKNIWHAVHFNVHDLANGYSCVQGSGISATSFSVSVCMDEAKYGFQIVYKVWYQNVVTKGYIFTINNLQ